MKPYRTKKLTEFPDVDDTQREGRKSSIGKLPTKGGDFRPYSRTKKRKATRRALKRADKQKAKRIDEKE